MNAHSPKTEDVKARERLIFELRSSGVTDMRVLSAIERVPRERFVPETFRHHAYDNSALPIDRGQTISQPLIVGLMTQALELDKRTKVLEIGTGSGYQTAILALLSRRVYTIERHKPLLKQAEDRFHELGLHNVTAKLGDGSLGWPEQAPFQRIIVTAAAHDLPPTLVDQLADGGIMVVPVGDDDGSQNLLKVTKHDGDVDVETICGVRFVPLLPGIAQDEGS